MLAVRGAAAAAAVAAAPGSIVQERQQYATLDGHGLTMRFATPADVASAAGADPTADAAGAAAHLLPFQRLPLTHPLPAATYSAVALQTWFDQQHESRLTIGAASRAPQAHTLARLGDLSTAYSTVRLPGQATHPRLATVEPGRTSHREGLNLSLTLWAEEGEPLLTTLLTGDGRDDARTGVVVSPEQAAARLAAERRPDRVAPAVAAALEEHFGLLGAPEAVPLPPGAGRRAGTVLYRQFGCWPRTAGADGIDGAAAASMVPPWAVEALVAGFGGAVSSRIAADVPDLAPGSDQGGVWQCVARNVTMGDVAPAVPFELVVVEPPKAFRDYRSHPVHHRLGAPWLRGGPAVMLQVELWQGAGVRGGGCLWFAAEGAQSTGAGEQ